MKSFCLALVRRLGDEDRHAKMALKLKTYMLRRLGDEDLRAKKALKMKTSTPRRLKDKDLRAKKISEPKTCAREDIGEEGLEDEGMCAKHSQRTISWKWRKKPKPKNEDIRKNKALRDRRLRN